MRTRELKLTHELFNNTLVLSFVLLFTLDVDMLHNISVFFLLKVMTTSAINLLQQLFGGFPQQPGNYQVAQEFKRKYHAYSPAYWNSENRDKLERGDKIVLPASALEELSRMHIQFPIMFEIANDSKILPVKSHCSVMEFTAPEGNVYLPLWMIDNLGLDASGDSVVELTTISLPKGSFVQFQAHETKFAMLSNPRVVLETALRSYSCLTVGDTIQVEFAEHMYKLDVTEVKPSVVRGLAPPAISIIETDIKVDFKEPRDYREWEKINRDMNIAKQKQKLIADEMESKQNEMDGAFVINAVEIEKRRKKTYFEELEANGAMGNQMKKRNSKSKNMNHNNNNSNTHMCGVYNKPVRGVPLGAKPKRRNSTNSMHVRKSSTTKMEEVVGNMRYIYEVHNGERRLIRRLQVRDWNNETVNSLK